MPVSVAHSNIVERRKGRVIERAFVAVYTDSILLFILLFIVVTKVIVLMLVIPRIIVIMRSLFIFNMYSGWEISSEEVIDCGYYIIIYIL